MTGEMLDEKAIFNAARQISSPDSRADYLRHACGPDSGLRERVQVLLRAYEEQASFLESPPPVGVAPTIDQPALESPGTVIGPYKLIEQIGEGGMGTVWMAQQTDPVKRLVALKLIKPGMDSKHVIARFEAERQALALMDHPNIARVLDGGTSTAGRPYFVMDLVKGVPITRYCDAHHLTPRQRLELFLPVCQAVQHAHQKGIIHRDLKPSNVLVTLYDGKPVPKVIDFGVAKATGHALTEKTLVTGFGAIVGTLEYMSPEQAEVNQLDIDTRSDVYSLGVLLYELLAGTPPFSRKELENAGLLEMLRVIREQEPSRPSTKLSTADGLPTLAANRGTDPSRLTRLVRGELDWIVMKALEKDRKRRYETASGFALDVQRYLADEPVLACPPSLGYRVRKFARRNKGGLLVAALVLLFLVVGGVGVGWAVRDRAARQSRIGAQVNLVLGEVGQLTKEQKWTEALEAARRAEALTAGGADGATQERVRQVLNDLQMVARLEELRLRDAYPNDPEASIDEGRSYLYATAFRDFGVDVEALPVEEITARLLARPAVAIALAAALDDWARVRRPKDREQSKRLWALATALDPDPWRVKVREASAGMDVATLVKLANAPEMARQPPQSQLLLASSLRLGDQPAQALSLLERACENQPGDFWIQYTLSQPNDSMSRSRQAEARVRHGAAARALRPRNPDTWNLLGLALYDQKELDEAITCYQKAIELDPKYVHSFTNLGNALAEQKKLDEAVAAQRKAIELDPSYVNAYVNLGTVLRDQKKLDEAITCYQKAIELNPKISKTYANLGNALGEQKKLPEAVAAFRKAIERDPKNAPSHISLGFALSEQKKLDEAIAAFRKAIELDPRDAIAQNRLGGALSDQGKLDEAIAAYSKAVELDPKFATAYCDLGIVWHKQKKLLEAVAAFRKAIELDPKGAVAHNNLGNALRDQDKLDEAIAAFRNAIELDPKDPGGHNNLGNALRDQNKLDEAITCYRKSIERDPKNAMAYGNRAGTYAALGQWAKAAADFERVGEVDPSNDEAWRLAAYAYLAAGDAATYRRTCRALVERFAKSNDPVMAERTAKVCLLARNAVADFGVVERLAQIAVTGTEKHGYYHFFVLAKGLTEGRAGRHAEAVKWLERFAPKADRGQNFDAIALAALAIAQDRVGRTDEAKDSLAKAKAIVAEKMPDPSKGRLFEGNWHDWVHAQLLSREAEEMLKKEARSEKQELK